MVTFSVNESIENKNEIGSCIRDEKYEKLIEFFFRKFIKITRFRKTFSKSLCL